MFREFLLLFSCDNGEDDTFQCQMKFWCLMIRLLTKTKQFDEILMIFRENESLNFFSNKNYPNIVDILVVYCTYSLLYLVSCPRNSCRWSLRDSWKYKSLIVNQVIEWGKNEKDDQVQSHVDILIGVRWWMIGVEKLWEVLSDVNFEVR